MAKMGRPRKEFDTNHFEKLCEILCTEEEIAGWFDMSVDTLERRCKEIYGETFADVYKKLSAPGKMSLRRAQFRLAEKSATMAIWLGKQYLGQRDTIEYHDESSANKLNELIEAVREV